ncbi:hypothetical protein ABK905_14595 [Acerihabitans sp. KWT182]|uniref:Uncharacterized protein n=1 Tax=Acerihabitans sp. KWT182 TaxID=3157919 RepID=A0AAU7Q4W8_9GAMM
MPSQLGITQFREVNEATEGPFTAVEFTPSEISFNLLQKQLLQNVIAARQANAAINEWNRITKKNIYKNPSPEGKKILEKRQNLYLSERDRTLKIVETTKLTAKIKEAKNIHEFNEIANMANDNNSSFGLTLMRFARTIQRPFLSARANDQQDERILLLHKRAWAEHRCKSIDDWARQQKQRLSEIYQTEQTLEKLCRREIEGFLVDNSPYSVLNNNTG